ncbi:MAG TPA: L,D-transpeptidase family protein [Gaiellaceae bacterium]|nr:L,D-transpeptidase family protein [Gaiellaceae bacterium]
MSYRRYHSAKRGRRAAAVLALVAVGLVVAAAGAPAGAPPGPAVAAPGVTVAGTPVDGLTPAQARAVVAEAFSRPLVLGYDGRSWQRAPAELGARADVAAAVRAAVVAPTGRNVPLRITYSRGAVRRWAAAIAASLDRPVRDAEVRLRGARPVVSKSQTGVRVRRKDAVRRIAQALELHARGPVALPVRRIEPELTRASVGPVVVVRRKSHRLVLYDGMRRVRAFGIATGRPSFPTPLGSFEIVTKQRDPWWYPPASGWAEGLDPVPPGPGNPLGTRWLGLDVYAVGIHGTPDAASIGYSASHGCVRMQIADAEWLFERVRVGTPVFIVDA